MLKKIINYFKTSFLKKDDHDKSVIVTFFCMFLGAVHKIWQDSKKPRKK